METLFAGNNSGLGIYRDTSPEAVKILLFSSHPLVIKGITGMLTDEPYVKLLGHASSTVEMMLRIHESDPSIVIMNDDERGVDKSSAFESVRSALTEFPKLNILMIMNGTDYEKELAALKTGIRGVLSDDFESDVLIECIKCISGGGLWFRRKVLEKFISERLFFYRLKENGRQELTLPTFTRRELEIIQMAGRGVKNREIGRSLFISEKTVKHHMSKIFRKLQIKRRAELRMYL